MNESEKCVDPVAVSLDTVVEAHSRVQSHIHWTPLLASRVINSELGARVHFKCENFQRTGAFKVRGAFNAVLSLSEVDVANGVVTSSSGNQAAALSLAAKVRGIRAYIAMPRNAVPNKVAAVRRYGGNIVWVESSGNVPTSEEYEATTAAIKRETGAAPVHPYNDLRTVAGQGTCALEMLKDLPDLDFLLAPVGGGGLLAGTALVAKTIRPTIQVIGCEPEMADDAQRSFAAGHVIPQTHPRTIADGLRTSLGELTFPIIASRVDNIVTVSEEAIVRAMRLIWETLKIVVEPSSAVPLAVLLERKLEVRGATVGVILTGGNVDLENLPWMTRLR
jgi:threonine dehydratase